MGLAAGKAELVRTADAAALAVATAKRIVVTARAAIAANGRFTLVLSGGSTPERLYRLLAQPEWKSQFDWPHTWLFFGDERFVPDTDERSNYRLAAQALLIPAQIDPTHVLAIPTTAGTPAQCAAAYEKQLRAFFPHDQLNARGFPQFDLVLLGLGDDGHTASLFPGKATLDERFAWLTWSTPGVLPPPVDRITFTFPLINSARNIMFLVAGAGKAAIVHDVLDNPPDLHKHPSSGVQPDDGKLVWMLDEAAAGLLAKR
ncbi:MAG TPA: 6-phosphogluconolactonase [Pirellulales bacterium]